MTGRVRSQAFDEQPHLQLLKEMLTQAFATPRRHHKSKPFCDHVLAFSVADSRIWLRNYQARLRLSKHCWARVRTVLVTVSCCSQCRRVVRTRQLNWRWI